MIIPGNALLALLSPPQEFQAAREEEGGFGPLLTQIEQHTVALPDQEEPERCALEGVLQVLMSIFQLFPASTPLPIVSTPGAGESSLGSARPVGELPLGLSPDDGTAPALWDPAEVNQLPGMVSSGAQDIAQVVLPALDGQSTGSLAITTGAPENFSWLVHRQANVPDSSGVFKAQPTAVVSVFLPAAELDVPSGAPLPATTPSFSQDSVLATAEAQSVSPGLQQTSLASRGESPAAAGLPQPGPSQSPAITPTTPLMGPAVATNTRPLAAGEQVFQNTSRTSQASPMDAAPAGQWAEHAAAPAVAQAPVPLPSSPQAETATTSDARETMAFVQENTVLAEYDAAPASRYRPENRESVVETIPSVAPFTTDSALPLSSARATSHIASAAPAIAVPTHHPLEDLGPPWPLPLPPNTMVLHLEPRELGALLLRVRVNDKRLIASFQAQSPEAETLLRSHLPSLHESLSQHGFEVQPIAITRATEGFSAHMGAGTGAFAHQHSAFQGFAEDWRAANASESQDEVDLQRTLRWPAEQRSRLLDVVI